MKTACIYKEIVYSEEKPAITVLIETKFTKEIRIVLKEGQVMKEHKTAYPIVVMLLEGALDFGVQGKILSLQKGDLLALDGNVPHDLKATKDSIVRLTLSKLDDVNRVKEVVRE